MVAPGRGTQNEEPGRLSGFGRLGVFRPPQNKYYVRETGQQTTIESEDLPSASTTLYFQECDNMEYIINSTCTRIKIEECRNTRFIFSGKVLTQTIEIWRSQDLDLQFGVQIQTLQLDHSNRVQLNFDTWEHFYSLVWVDSDQLSLSFRDNDTLSFHTGIGKIREERPELDPSVNQFIVKLEGEHFTTEAVRREIGGYLNENR